MDMNHLQCSGCGSSEVDFDPQSRTLVCRQCGKKEFYSRATLNASGKVVYGRQNALKFFREGTLESAQHYAREVLNVSMDNAPALFILAYYNEFVEKHTGAMKKFFQQIQPVALEYDEVQELRELLVATASQLEDYEGEIITLLAQNMQAEEDSESLCATLDKICPCFLKRRTSCDFLSRERIEMYQDLAEHCVIPKTCLALLSGIKSNPDSPFASDSFYLRSKAQYFYDHYVLAVGSIVERMKENPNKQKFLRAYETVRKEYSQAMQTENQ